MEHKKDDSYYLDKILTDLQFMIQHTAAISQAELEANEVLADSVMFRLIQIAENTDKLSAAFKEKYLQIPWRAMKGLRNRIVHDYGEVDLGIIYDTVQYDIPQLFALLSDLQ